VGWIENSEGPSKLNEAKAQLSYFKIECGSEAVCHGAFKVSENQAWNTISRLFII